MPRKIERQENYAQESIKQIIVDHDFISHVYFKSEERVGMKKEYVPRRWLLIHDSTVSESFREI